MMNNLETHTPRERETWSSGLAFVLAASGSAIGLGNIWKFPYVTGENGGGAFVLFYLVCILVVGVTLMIGEVLLGRATRSSPIRAIQTIHGNQSRLRFLGYLSVCVSFTLLSFYNVVGGWCVYYLYKALTFGFGGLDPAAIEQHFGVLFGSPWLNVVGLALFLATVTFITMYGVRQGLERWSRILMPMLMGLIVTMVLYAGFSSSLRSGLVQTWTYLFQPNFSALTGGAMVAAVGHAFFTLSLGLSNMVTYGSYLPAKTNIPRLVVRVATLDTVAALLVCFAIFPIVFANGFAPSGGPGLVFQTLPVIFTQLYGGGFLAILFFALLLFAAVTSAISIFELVVSSVTEAFQWTRKKACLISASTLFVVGLAPALSGNLLSNIKTPASWQALGNKSIFDLMDYAVSNVGLPLVGIFAALFIGWLFPADLRRKEFEGEQPRPRIYQVWQFSIRFVVPAMLTLVFFNLLGLLG